MRYHELTAAEIAEKLDMTKPDVEQEIRIMNAKFYLAVDDITREEEGGATCH